MTTTGMLAFGLGVFLVSEPSRTSARERSLDEVRALFEQAEARGLVRKARKTRLVDARPAKPGEVIVTVIAGEGKETRSKPAEKGDWVVRNRCEPTGDEEYLVAAAKFKERYRSTGKAAGKDGWQEHRPDGKVMRFFVLEPEDREFVFTAPWGERRVAKPGDMIVQDPESPQDTYRVAAAAFACTYEVLD
ncbi:MAG TPA: hypothetical protein VLL75_02825 [Vicinamibacteria bacterium]|nr:hypothetical protein [Vicinamibacteria bacterium]